MNWLTRAKARRTSGTLNNLIKLELEEIGVDWCQFDTVLEELKSYYEKFGHTNVGQSLADEEYKHLAHWGFNQRLNYHDGKLSQDKIDKLNELKFNWKLEPRVKIVDKDNIGRIYYTDEDRLEQLKAFKEEHGHLNVSKTKDGELGRLVQKIRDKYKLGNLDGSMILKCLAWSHWSGMYNQLCAYKEEFWHTRPPAHHEEGYAALANWCNTARLGRNKGTLSEDRVKLLEDIRFEWSEKVLIPWEDMLKQLVEYKEEFGNTSVPKLWAPNKRLARWVHSQ
ncbi:hypothetical protein ACHAXN_000667 [Cyclotella atomus]